MNRNHWFSGGGGEGVNLQEIIVVWKAESENSEKKLYSTNVFEYIRLRSVVEQKQHAQAVSSSDFLKRPCSVAGN